MRLSPCTLFAPPLVVLLGGCGAAPMDSEPAKMAVMKAFSDANPPGRAGLLLKGHHIWLEAPYFVPSCIEEKGLAFNDDPRQRPSATGQRITPTYDAQRYLLKNTDQGYCLLLGVDPTITLGEASYGQDRWRIDATLSVKDPSPWFACIDPRYTKFQVEVVYDKAGVATVATPLDFMRGDCPANMVGDVERVGKASVGDKGAPAPSKAEVVTLVRAFDAALESSDQAGALALSSCVNLFASPPWGACTLSELLTVGPSFAAKMAPGHGTPWLEYGLGSPEDIDQIVKDADLPGVFHVRFHHKRSDRTRSFSVQRVGGEWRMLGVVERKAAGLTSARYLLDLHDKDRRAILVRRLAGEDLDAEGNSNRPPVEAE